MNFRQKMVVIIADLLILVQLTVSVYMAQQKPAEISLVFMKNFFPMVICTLAASRYFMKKFSSVRNPREGNDGMNHPPDASGAVVKIH